MMNAPREGCVSVFGFDTLFLALAISFDSFIAGVSYGCARIRVPIGSLVITGAITGLVMYCSMSVGGVLAALTGERFARWLGGSLLILLGAYALNSSAHNTSSARPVLKLSFLGVIVHVIGEPMIADRDRSCVIDSKEALVLGTALAMDAFGVGLGAALAGMRVLGMTMLAAFGCPLLLAAGAAMGRSARFVNASFAHKLPAWTLITIGLLRFW